MPRVSRESSTAVLIGGRNVTKNDLIPKKKRKHGESLQHEPKCLQLRDELFHTDKHRFGEEPVRIRLQSELRERLAAN
jgi:hypothetical protein